MSTREKLDEARRDCYVRQRTYTRLGDMQTNGSMLFQAVVTGAAVGFVAKRLLPYWTLPLYGFLMYDNLKRNLNPHQLNYYKYAAMRYELLGGRILRVQHRADSCQEKDAEICLEEKRQMDVEPSDFTLWQFMYEYTKKQIN